MSQAVAWPIPARAASSAVLHRLGRLPFVGGRLLSELAAEGERQRPGGSPGDVLRRLAVSRQLREAVSAAVGEAMVPTYHALYQYHDEGTKLRRHRDGDGYDVVFHLTVFHEAPSSVLVVDEEAVSLAVGEGLVLRGQEVVHGWTPMAPGERRTLVAVGFMEGTRA